MQYVQLMKGLRPRNIFGSESVRDATHAAMKTVPIYREKRSDISEAAGEILQRTTAGIRQRTDKLKKILYFSIISITSGVTPVKLKPPS